MRKRCNNMGRKVADITNQRFGRLTVVQRVENPSQKQSWWLCKCDCGNIKKFSYSNLISGHTKSCGCLRREITNARNKKINTKHHMCEHPLYDKWTFMKSRCYYVKNDSFSDYGGRGIIVCDEWKDNEKGFINFYNWSINNGWKKGLTLDRIDNDGNYCPENCRWTDAKKQQRNRRITVFLEYNGQKLPLSEWAEKFKIPYSVLIQRHSAGWDDKKIITTPIRIRKKT